MNISDLQSFIYEWMTTETGITIIFANQNRPRPEFPYGTIWLPGMGERIGGIDELRSEDGGETFDLHAARTTMASLNIYGDDANDRMSKLRDSLDRPDVIELFSAENIAHLGETGPNDLTEFEDTRTIERSQMDLELSYSTTSETPVEPIEEVEVTHEGGISGDDDESFTVNIEDS